MKRLFFILLVLVTVVSCKQVSKQKYVFNEGFVYGTIYNIVYSSPNGEDLINVINAELKRSDLSLSTFNEESVISKVNRNESVVLDDFFIEVFNTAEKISKKTNGAFDVTVMPFVNAWGFGFKKRDNITASLVDSISEFVGYEKVGLKSGKIRKADSRLMLDFSAIAKGFGVDLVARVLDEKGCENYMVEIGGEVVAKGVNREGRVWRIGINEPNDNEPMVAVKVQAIVSLKNKALATSGNYRNFYIKDGKKYAHTIDPKTGYPIQHSLLSATVLADNCMTADAYATSFMVMGIEKAMAIVERNKQLEGYFIYAGNDGTHQVQYTKGFSQYLDEMQ